MIEKKTKKLTKEELNELKTEYKAFTTKLKDLTEEELTTITGGFDIPFVVDDNEQIYNPHIYIDRDPDFKK